MDEAACPEGVGHPADAGRPRPPQAAARRRDSARTLGAEPGKTAPLFAKINRNKRARRLDLKQPAGVDVFMTLVRGADAVVEGFRPGVVDRLGIGYAACAAINPRIVYCAISGYGQSGPYRDVAGHDVNYCGYEGLVDQIGIAQGDPASPNLQIAATLEIGSTHV